ncbi:MAG: sigma-70 family RNA polymerase sigma factor [Polyangiaceae bacterium]
MPASPLTERPSERLRVARFPPERRGDAQLVADAADGDRAAMGVIWDRYARLVRGVLVGVLGPDSAIEDLMQDVFLALHKGARSMKDKGALRAYLIQTAVRSAAFELRKRKVRRWVGLSPTGDLPEVPAPPLDIESRETLRALYRVLERLSERRRLAFVLRHVQGLEMLEVAAALAISESTTRRELTSARQQLAALVRREPALALYVDRFVAERGAP